MTTSETQAEAETDPVRAGSPTPQRAIGLAAGIGAWVLFSGIFFTGAGWIVPHNVIVGAAIAAVGSYAAAFPGGGPVPGVVATAVTALLGLWLLASAFVFDPAGILFWNNVIVGAVVVVLGVGTVVTGRK
ncbi:SPW repeat domain-containing protein [Halobiforma nitratireducens]|uniref:SPW repeat-containing protein n=1 Tax=Halobiforma nitratireducens JCM 10879 TaxID=1227454 RepID=M0MJU2_9EURY|nr:SPW repeat protein [Halobiforma nitratireducens]EMA45962.1 SPW repeat-containing protein [Halobiforma nitratireducens JCM 10879]